MSPDAPSPEDRSGLEPDPYLTSRARDLLERPPIARLAERIRQIDGQTLADQAELTEIPAPPFGESERATRIAELFQGAGLAEIEIDAEGNVLARLGDGAPERPPFILSAHLDTVFPAGTDVRVRTTDGRLRGPGISDDGRGLAALVAVARALSEVGTVPGAPLLLVATVGEEGVGDLRGVRYLFREGGPAREARAFISLDGAGLSRLVTAGLGSRRYRVTVRGPGGHSWVNFGIPNPIHALGRLVAEAASLDLPPEPRTSLTVARWAGGTSVNAIPQEAWVEVEARSEGPEPLELLERRIRSLAEQTVAAENALRKGTGTVRVTVEVIGNRPAGRTGTDDPLVRAAAAATRALDAAPDLAVSSTDANIPMTLGIPALTMGAGGEAGNAHTTEEWYRNVRGPEGIVRPLLVLALLDEIETDP